jgi:cell division protein FtsB
MSRIKDFRTKYLSKNKMFWLVIVGVVAFTFTVGDSSLYKRYTYDEQIRSLEKEIMQYKDEIGKNKKKLDDLRMNKEGLERIAREDYRMKRPNEEVFIIK